MRRTPKLSKREAELTPVNTSYKSIRAEFISLLSNKRSKELLSKQRIRRSSMKTRLVVKRI